MKIYKLNYDVDRYDSLIPLSGITDIPRFDGTRRKQIWKPVKVCRMEPEKNNPLGDAPSFAFPIYSSRAINILSNIIQDSVELLPLMCDEGEFSAVNIVNVIDAVDYQNSFFKTFRDGKRIMRFIDYSFIKEAVADNNIFKITDEVKNSGFVSETFKKKVEDNELKGFVFKLVWEG